MQQVKTLKPRGVPGVWLYWINILCDLFYVLLPTHLSSDGQASNSDNIHIGYYWWWVVSQAMTSAAHGSNTIK